MKKVLQLLTEVIASFGVSFFYGNYSQTVQPSFLIKRKSIVAFLFLLLFCSTIANAQLSGAYSIKTGGSYTTLAAAITALNTSGVSGAVTFNIGDGTNPFTETAPAGGYVIGSAVLNTGGAAPSSAVNTVTFQPAGSSTVTITAEVGTGAADAIFTLNGVKGITINRFILNDANNSAGAKDMEYGFLITNSGSVGAQTNLIENSTITLYANNSNHTYGIFQTGNGTVIAAANSSNVYSGITVVSANQGIVLLGSTTTAAMDQSCRILNCTVGSSSTLTVGSALGSGDSVVCYGAYNQSKINIIGNTAENITTTSNPNILYGISFFNSISSSNTSTINTNTITNLTSTISSSSCKLGGINVTTAAQNTVQVYGNTIQTISMPKALIFGIYYNGTATDTASLYGNTIKSITGTAGSSSTLYGIYAVNAESISGNIFNTLTNAGTTTTAGIYYIGGSNAGSIFNNSLTSVSYTSGSSASTYGIYANNAVNVYGNTLNTMSSGRGMLAGIYYVGNSTNTSIYNNTLTGFTSTTGSSSDSLIAIFAEGSTSDNISIYGSTIQTFSGAYSVFGIDLVPGSSTTANNVYGNTVTSVTTGVSSPKTVQGIYVTAASNTTNIYANKVGGISSSNGASSTITEGIGETGTSSSTVNIYDNFVYNITSTSSNSSTTTIDIRGIDVEGSGTIANVYFNSIYLYGSATAACSIADLYIASGITTDSRDNIFKNYYATSSSRVSYGVYNGGGLNESDYNIYDLASSGGTFDLGYSGSSGLSSLVSWQSAISGDLNAKQFTVSFVSSTDLHLAVYIADTRYYGNSTTPALNISVTTDIDGQTRVIPIIGADEITFSIPAVVFNTDAPSASDVSQSSTTNLIYGISLTDNNALTKLTSIAFTTAGGPGAGYTTGDFLNFQLWSSTSPTFSTSTATSIATAAGTPAQGSNITFTPATSVSLNTGTTTYLFITMDVSAGATLGDSISIQPLDSTLATLSPSAYKLGSADTLVKKLTAYGADFTVAKFYYNTGYKTGGSSDLTATSAWNTNLAGTGGSPTLFSSPNQVFNFVDATSYTMSGSLTVSGTNSKIVTGNATTAITFAPTQQLISIVDVTNNATLDFTIDPTSTTLGILSVGSTVQYGGAVSQSVLTGNYYNLTLSGSGNRNLTVNAGVAGTFTPNTYTAFTTNSATMTFNGTTTQTVPGFTYNGLTINNTSGTTTKTTGNTTINAALNVTTAFDIPVLETLTLGSTGTVPSTTGGLTIDGTMVNPVSGSSPITSSSGTLTFSPTGLYWLTAAPTTTTGVAQIPLATWSTYSVCKITGLVGPSGSDYNGLAGIDQPFSNLYIDCAGLAGRLVLGFNANGSFQVKDTLTVNSTGTGAASNNATRVIQLTSLNGQTSINVGAYVQHSGSVYVSDNTTSSNSRTLTVAGAFTVDNTNSAVSGNSIFYLSDPNSGSLNGILNVGGNFSMATGTALNNNKNGNATQSAGYVIFTGTSAQTASFGTVSSGATGDINFTVSNSTNTVTLLSNLNCGTLSLTGKLAINGNTLTLNGRTSSYLQATGAFISNGTAGTLSGSSASQLIVSSSATYPEALKFTYDASKNNNSLYSIAFANTLIDTLKSSLYIYGGTSATPGVVNVGSGATFTTNDSLTLESNASGTARIASNTSGSTYINGKVTIERYAQSHRAWRLVTAPITTDQTINASWQEGVTNTAVSGGGQFNPVTGYGTEVTNTIATSSSTGYDKAATNNPSVLYMNSGTHLWVAPSATNGGGTTSGIVSNDGNGQQGYMLFLRGNRGVIVTTPPFNPSDTTIIRVKGSLKQGSVTVTPPNTGFQVMGNPYASETSLLNIFNTKSAVVGVSYYAWDPLLASSLGVGAFVTYNYTGGTFVTSVPPTSPFIAGVMESSQAIVLNYITTGTITLNETDKSTSSELVFRPADDTSTDASFRGELWSVNDGDSLDLDDGTLNLFNSSYSDTVSWLKDSRKLGNSAENMAIEAGGYYLAIYKSQPISVTDTIFYYLGNMRQGITYQFSFAGANINQPGLVGFLQDTYLNTLTPISLADNDTSKVNFQVTSDAASQGGKRFRIIFETAAGGPLPVTYTSITAYPQNADIAVAWNVTNELNVKEYVVEKSTDGKNFTQIGTVTAKGNNMANTLYNWLDETPAAGDNYYRIISIDNTGKQTYSQVVKVKIGASVPLIAVYPNPVTNGIINLQLTDMPKGKYGIRLMDNLGQVVLEESIEHAGGSSNQPIHFNGFTSKGIYHLEIINPDNTITTLKLITE